MGKYIIVIVLGYLLGTSNLAYYISKWKHVDFTKSGSRNLGASNATMLLGWKTGIMVRLHDSVKSLAAVVIARLLFPDLEHAGVAAGIASVVGHIFPFYLRFRGGKGFASYLGMTLALNWKVALAVIGLVLVVTWITDYIVAGTTTTIVVVPVALGIMYHSWILALILLVGTVVIAYKHRENFVRIYRGTEFRVRNVGRGEHRIPGSRNS